MDDEFPQFADEKEREEWLRLHRVDTQAAEDSEEVDD